MPIEHGLLETLCCPVGRSPLRMMTLDELQALNEAIAKGRARYAGGEPVTESFESGLATHDGASFYRIQDGVPILLPGFRIVRTGESAQATSSTPGADKADLWLARWGVVSNFWDHIQAPVRPAPQDVALLERLVLDGLSGRGRTPPRVLLLGVTPEIATMRWPAGTQLLAIDSCMPMIRNVWPARAVPDALVALADWLAMPVRDAAYDAVVGDGSVNMIGYPDGFSAFVGAVRRVLKDDGMLAMRVFARPERTESVDTIFDDLRGGRIGNIDIFYWRLAMALHRDLAAGTRLGDLWEAWHDRVPDPDALMTSLGWPLELPREFIEVMQGFEGRMVFPTVRELGEALAPEFRQVACHFPDYETGERYPTLVFKPGPHGGGHVRP